MRRLGPVLFSAVSWPPRPATAQSNGQAAPVTPAPTFTKDVAPILYTSCVSCHRSGEIGPMALISYQDARPWSKSIREKVVKKEMPPRSADPAREKEVYWSEQSWDEMYAPQIRAVIDNRVIGSGKAGTQQRQ